MKLPNDDFLLGYLEGAIFSAPEDKDGDWARWKGRTAGDLPRHVVREAIKDCRAFQKDNAELLARYYAAGLDACAAGYDFVLTRNGHGAGFWDRDLGMLGDDLTRACKPFGSWYLMLGPRGGVWVGR